MRVRWETELTMRYLLLLVFSAVTFAEEARFIRIELLGKNRVLTLAEVEVVSKNKNIAPQGKASQSSTAHNGVASRALDGNRQPFYKRNGQSHTDFETNPWWELDLGAVHPVQRIDIYNRSEGGHAGRLDGFTIRLLDAERKEVRVHERLKAPEQVIRIDTTREKKQVFYLTSELKDGRAFSARRASKPDHTASVVSKDPELAAFGIYKKTAPKPEKGDPASTILPLKLKKGERIALIGNTLFDRGGRYGQFEAMVQKAFPRKELRFRNLAWSADEVDLMPRPDNFGDIHQHLHVVEADVVFAAFGYNESFAGPEAIPAFKQRLAALLGDLKRNLYNRETPPRIVLVSPIANENLPGTPAADLNNANIAAYTAAMKEVAAAQHVGFADVFAGTKAELAKDGDLTINGAHLTDAGYEVFARELFRATFDETAPETSAQLREAIADKNLQWFRRYRPLNTFYYVGGRNGRYGYLDFLPAMRSFEVMVSNRDEHIWAISQGDTGHRIDDSNVPEMPKTPESRGANEWLSPADELKAFKLDERVEVNLFASEKEFPDIACPIQMRWDGHGRLWVACSTTYPHIYPGGEHEDKIVILEDTDWDGKADKSTVFADDVHVPLSFTLAVDEKGHYSCYVSEEPGLTVLADTDGDLRMDTREEILTGFGTEDSHHALHDFIWTPDGDLLFRESIFHNSQVETPYGPVRAKNSAWFLYDPPTRRLTTFGAYPNTNPWGVTFTHWGYHVASHPIFASAFHGTNPAYPEQHPRAAGIPAYSGVCGQEFVDWDHWPEEMKGKMIKVRYKPTNRVELHDWIEGDDNFAEKYEGDLIFSSNLSFIPVDARFGPRGAFYVCDWYNPIKGHAQYSLRDERRDRNSGRIWRMTPKGAELPTAVTTAGKSTEELVEMLTRPEYAVRHWAKRELRGRSADEVVPVVKKFIHSVDFSGPTLASPDAQHAILEGLWVLNSFGVHDAFHLERCILSFSGYDHARAAGVRFLRDPSVLGMEKTIEYLQAAAMDQRGLVRMEAVNAATYIGTKEALDAILPVLDQPMGSHLSYATRCALGSAALKPHWEGDESMTKAKAFYANWGKRSKMDAMISKRSASQASFDKQRGVKTVTIGCIPERLLYDVTSFKVKAGQPVKLIFKNPDATAHNLLIVKPGAAEEIGLAGNEMAKDPKAAKKHFIPTSDKVLHATKLLQPNTAEVLRFKAPTKPGVYPYVCTFPGHWVLMQGKMIVE